MHAYVVLLLALLSVPPVQCPYGAVSYWTADEGQPAVPNLPIPTPARGQQVLGGIAVGVAAAVAVGVVGCSEMAGDAQADAQLRLPTHILTHIRTARQPHCPLPIG